MLRYFYLLSFILPLALLQGCVKDQVTRKYTLLKPVFKEKSQVLSEVSSNAAKEISNAGKIYVYGKYLFVNEVNKGVHVIDNSNPENPINRRFINIPGNVDIAVKGNFLYADIFTDMLTIDISDPLEVKLTSVEENVFPERKYLGVQTDSSQYIVDWLPKDTIVNANDFSTCRDCGVFFDMTAFSSQAELNSSFSKVTTGISGSMARFTIVGNYLYAVNLSTLISFDISNLATPERLSATSAGWNIETIYPFKGNLFIGSTTGMFIYNIDNPSQPVYTSRIQHLQFCDPVIADDDYAYVTLRSGSECGNILESQLQIIDISTLSYPLLIKTYSMDNPYGLGKTGNLLWICDGVAGLKVFDAKDPVNLKQKYFFKNIEPFDVIPLGNIVIVSAKDGIVQYRIGENDEVSEISRINKRVL